MIIMVSKSHLKSSIVEDEIFDKGGLAEEGKPSTKRMGIIHECQTWKEAAA
jgi:hypothetical protein